VTGTVFTKFFFFGIACSSLPVQCLFLSDLSCFCSCLLLLSGTVLVSCSQIGLPIWFFLRKDDPFFFSQVTSALIHVEN
jgi:hypothetical protein